MNKTDKTKNSPSANYAMYELDRVAKREAQKASGKPELPQGTPVMCNGYRGAIIRHYDGNMYEIRLERGIVCTDAFQVIEAPKQAQPAKQGEQTRTEKRVATLEYCLAITKEELVATRNHAGKLADALRDLRDVSWPDPACAKADAALAAWKKANLAESKV